MIMNSTDATTMLMMLTRNRLATYIVTRETFSDEVALFRDAGYAVYNVECRLA